MDETGRTIGVDYGDIKPLGGKKFFYTFGSDPLFSFQNGWVEVHANSLAEAHEKFRSLFPDRSPNCLNCAFYCDEENWKDMNPEQNWHEYRCYKVIK